MSKRLQPVVAAAARPHEAAPRAIATTARARARPQTRDIPPDRAADALTAFLEQVEAAPHAFDFFALLRRVDALQPENPRYGSAPRPLQEPLRLGQDPDLHFASAALSSFTLGGRGMPRLGTRFFGLLGSNGPMPLFVTEHVRDRLRNSNDAAPARFLDLFHHRMLAIFYRAWAQAQPAVQHDRPSQDRFTAWLGASSGVAVAMPDASQPKPPNERLAQSAQLYHAGFLGSRSRHPEGLCKILASHLDVQVTLQRYVAQRIVIGVEDRTPMRNTHTSLGIAGPRANGLGMNATAGRYAWDRQSKFRLHIGPLSFDRFAALLPGQPAWQHLCDWVDRYVGQELCWDVGLTLDPTDVPESRLGRQVRLGLTTWLGRAPAPDRQFKLRLRSNAKPRFFLARTSA